MRRFPLDALLRSTLLLVAALAGFAVPPASVAGPNDLATAPVWTLQDLDGRTIRLGDFRGKIVVLDFWATWCPPCRREIPGLIELQKKYGPCELAVVGISLDEDPQVVRAVARALGINYVVVTGTLLVASLYGNITVIPSTFIINREGRMVAVHEGFVETATLEADLAPFIGSDR